jgi:hypothetical protein
VSIVGHEGGLDLIVHEDAQESLHQCLVNVSVVPPPELGHTLFA